MVMGLCKMLTNEKRKVANNSTSKTWCRADKISEKKKQKVLLVRARKIKRRADRKKKKFAVMAVTVEIPSNSDSVHCSVPVVTLQLRCNYMEKESSKTNGVFRKLMASNEIMGVVGDIFFFDDRGWGHWRRYLTWHADVGCYRKGQKKNRRFSARLACLVQISILRGPTNEFYL